MSEPKWTPGPWNAIDCGTGWVVGPREADSDDYIADVHLHTHGISDESAEANANLIAAAPMLYEALDAIEWALVEYREDSNGLVGCCPSCEESVNEGHEVGCQLAAALARARGEKGGANE